MKKMYLKLIPLFIVIVFSLSGCVSLEQLKYEHAIWKDTSNQTILWQGEEYLLLKGALEKGLSPELDYNLSLSVTNEDIPTLLSFYEGDYVNVSVDKNFLCVYGEVYCIKELHEEMTEYLQKDLPLEQYAYRYIDENDEEQIRFLTEKQKKALKVVDIDQLELSEYEPYDHIAEFYRYSDDKRLQQYAEVELWMSEDGQYLWNDMSYESAGVYYIPEEHRALIEEIFKDAIDAHYAWAEEYTE